MFPKEDPFDVLDGISPPRFPYLPAPPGFTPIAKPGDILWPAGSASLHDVLPALPGRYHPEPPGYELNVLGLSMTISPIDRVPSGDSVERCSSSSSVASDDSDGDAGLLASILGPSSFGSSVVRLLLLQCCRQSSRIILGRTSETCSALANGSGGPVSVPHSGVGGFDSGCAFRNTTYRPSDFALPSGKYGLPLHHPRFLEWIGAPELARLLDKGPSAWMHSLSREQDIDAGRQLHRDMCLMTSNLNILDQ